MKSDLTILLEFLEGTGPEVTGRQAIESENHVAELFERFARATATTANGRMSARCCG